jgi:hypothetical protein
MVLEMPLTNDEIATIAEWEPIKAGFGRDEGQTARRIRAIVDQINSFSEFGCKMLEDDGLSNYFVVFAFVRAEVRYDALSRNVEGLLVYLSSCGPVGVVGRSRHFVGTDFLSHGVLEMDTLISPDQAERRLEEVVFEAIRSGGYQLLSPAEVKQPLPPGVKPFEYCLSQEPWDRVFHALFGNTD